MRRLAADARLGQGLSVEGAGFKLLTPSTIFLGYDDFFKTDTLTSTYYVR